MSKNQPETCECCGHTYKNPDQADYIRKFGMCEICDVEEEEYE